MGSMSMELVSAMLRNFHAAGMEAQNRREAELASRADQPPTWRWSPGTFVFPEGLCCYCGGVMRSPCIWRAENQQFYGSWKLVGDGGGLGHFEFMSDHPHVNEGSICMGAGNYRAASVADALFLAFNPLSMYFGGEGDLTAAEVLKEWLADRFDHTCGFKLDVKPIEGVDIRHVVAPEAGCHCGHCRRHRGETQCPREECREWYQPGVGHGRYSCNRCGPMPFCFPHAHQIKQCVGCRSRLDLWSTREGLIEPPPIIKCEKCGGWVCNYCMSPEAGRAQHRCVRVSRDGGDVEEEAPGCNEHHCADCCREAGCDRCEDCDLYPSDCDC